MKKVFGDKLDVKIFTLNSLEAQAYSFKSATNVLFNQELLPLDVSTDITKMEEFLNEKLG